MNAIEMADVGFRALLLGHVLQRAEPSHAAVRIDISGNRLDRLAHLDPRVVGATEAIFQVHTSAGPTRLKRCCTKPFAVHRMQYVEPLARAFRHTRRIDADELRKRLRPTLE